MHMMMYGLVRWRCPTGHLIISPMSISRGGEASHMHHLYISYVSTGLILFILIDFVSLM